MRACAEINKNNDWKEGFEVRLELPKKRELKALRKEGDGPELDIAGDYIENPAARSSRKQDI